MAKLFLIIIVFTQLVSCGKDSAFFESETVTSYNVEPAKEENFVYEFSLIKCSTGKQSSETFEEICEKLSNHDLNNDCAESKREELFQKSQCSGTFISSKS